ncbi:MAG: hypothetical protein GTO53_10970 [Planctomycetales bacterium]|nr:hypothetical protein [Planctomycetales bacterium]NIM09640.1 hypothetical protein [Planctomycetales bacterium]NIN09123.1 hypothetical protein [Planctomycetales bacterium]NIN78230.1 hypothetical protein [Planctomycetales bacterium]NIO35421.1 hypothetical protein [Planctomycetales bacterium]
MISKTIRGLTVTALLGCSGPAPLAAQGPLAHDLPGVARPGPAGFPAGLPTSWSTPALPPAAAPPTPQLVEAAQIIARVGDEIIQAGDITASVDALMEENRDRIPAEHWDQQRQVLIQQSLKRAIETKLVFVDALRTIPPEAFPNVEEQVNQQFHKEYVKILMESLKVGSLAELETKLSANGSSIERQRQNFLERSLAAQWVRQNTKDDQPIGHDEMVRHYQEHTKDYEHPARVKWQQLTVYVSGHPDKESAYQKIVTMGNEILIEKADFAEVARRQSEGATAPQGGQRDWTTRGALKSKLLDEALFSLPVGRLSPILEEKDAFHIVRVLQREPAGRTSFRDAQIEIRGKIKNERREAARQAYFERLRKEIRVWTIFDDPVASREAFSSTSAGR